MKIVADNATISNKQTQELSDGLLNDYLTVTVSNDEELLNSEYMAVKSHEGNEQTFDMYRITNVQTNDDTTTFTGIQLAYYELAGYVVEDIRPVNRTVSYVASQLLSGTEWRVGYVESNLPNVTDRFYYLSAKDSFTKLQETANCEVVFKVEISGQGVTDKWVEIYSRLGNRTLKRFSYGSNALTVEREIGKNDIYTALIGRGKGEEVGDGYGRKLTFEDVVWSTANGNPVNKPKGQKYIELPQATAEYGIKTSSGKVPRIGIVEFEETEDAGELLQATYNSLVGVARPKVQFKSTVVNIGATNIGDTVTIHRHDLDIHYETRVYKVVRDKLDDDFTEVTLGDAISQSSTRKQARFYNTINNLQSNQNELATQVNYIGHTADGKNAINWGNNEPQFKRTGDLWFRDHPSITGERQMLVWTGLTWEIETDTSDLTKVEKEVSAIVTQADTDRTETVQKINQALIDSKVYADEVTTVSALRTKVLASDVITADMIQSNVSVVDKLFATDANVNRLTAKTAFINSVKAIDIAADRITTGNLNAAKVAIINLDASRISTGTLSGISITSQFNYVYSGSIRNVGTMTMNNGEISMNGTFTNSYGTAYLKLNADGLYGENLMSSGSVRSLFKLNGDGVTVVKNNETAYYRQDGVFFEAGGDASIRYYSPNARIEIGSYNGVSLGVNSSGVFYNRITTGGGQDGLAPFVDIWTDLNLRSTLNVGGNTVKNAAHITGVKDILFANSSNRIVQGSDNILNIMSPMQINMGFTDGTITSTSLTISNGAVTLNKPLQLNGNRIDGATNINGAQNILFNGSSNRIVQASDGSVNILSPIQLNFGWTNGSSTFTTMIITQNQIVAKKQLNMDGNSITNQSDRRLKNVRGKTLIDSLGAISKWCFVDYTWKASDKPTGNQFGVIAQDTPELQLYDPESDIYSIDSSKQNMMNSHAIQQLNQKVISVESIANASNAIAGQALSETQQLRLKVEELENKIKQLESAA